MFFFPNIFVFFSECPPPFHLRLPSIGFCRFGMIPYKAVGIFGAGEMWAETTR